MEPIIENKNNSNIISSESRDSYFTATGDEEYNKSSGEITPVTKGQETPKKSGYWSPESSETSPNSLPYGNNDSSSSSTGTKDIVDKSETTPDEVRTIEISSSSAGTKDIVDKSETTPNETTPDEVRTIEIPRTQLSLDNEPNPDDFLKNHYSDNNKPLNNFFIWNKSLFVLLLILIVTIFMYAAINNSKKKK